MHSVIALSLKHCKERSIAAPQFTHRCALVALCRCKHACSKGDVLLRAFAR